MRRDQPKRVSELSADSQGGGGMVYEVPERRY